MKGKEHFLYYLEYAGEIHWKKMLPEAQLIMSSQPDLIVENGLNPGVTYFDGIGSSG